MSGTPLQNNTFDIFAQMNFLNPGMLGSIEFFRQEFAVPIDKFGEQDRKDHLRKLLYPFILRRTKEQVAKDLPEKTETILFCEMEDEQRKVYDAYRNDYRDKILGTIEMQGIQRSQLTILQGLMKLRQICDSPAILNEQDRYPNHSIKLDELAREITENIGDHKALIFSQFLGMLALIRERLKELDVKYEYFDANLVPDLKDFELFDFPLLLQYSEPSENGILQTVIFDVRDGEFHMLLCSPAFTPKEPTSDPDFYSRHLLLTEQEIFSTPSPHDMAEVILKFVGPIP